MSLISLFSLIVCVRENIRTRHLFPHKLNLCWRRFSTPQVADVVVNSWIISCWATRLRGLGFRPMLGMTQETALFTFPWELMIYVAMQICLALFNCSVFNSSPVFSLNTWEFTYLFAWISFKISLQPKNASVFPPCQLIVDQIYCLTIFVCKYNKLSFKVYFPAGF